MPPQRSAIVAYSASTLAASDTSTAWKNASRQSAAAGSPVSALTSATQTVAPSSEKSFAASRPIPPAAPVITQTFPASLVMSLLRRDEDVLDLRVALQRVHAELAAEARLLEAAERRRDAYRAVRVDREHTGLERARHPQGPRAVARPDRAGKAVRRVVRERDRVCLVPERNQRRDRAEALR